MKTNFNISFNGISDILTNEFDMTLTSCGDNCFNINYYSNACEDFDFAISARTPIEFIDKFAEYASFEFDVDEHVKEIIKSEDELGGIPSVEILLEDAKDIKCKLEEAAFALKNIEFKS